MMRLRIAWATVLVVSSGLAACGGSSIGDPAGASGGEGGAPTGGSGGRANPGDPEGLAGCNPLDDTCADGTYCQLWSGHLVCVETGSTERDAPCEKTETCERGSICLSAGEFAGKTCQQPCPLDEDPWAVCDIGRHTCFVATDDEDAELPFGVCRY